MSGVRDGWEAVIGMEVHCQLATASKMFCGCSTEYIGAPPNSNVCPTCLGLPGTLPVINRRAVELCVRSALALNCEVQAFTKFDRKNYFYPDLPKGYQISQYDLPMSRNGWLDLGGDRIRIRRVHLEEDTGKLLHAGDKLHAAQTSSVDLNRAGIPLMEIVSEPDLGSAAQARDYGLALRAIFRAIGASEADMEKGHLRVEPNVSVRRLGESELGVKTELKNLNSFRALHLAVEHEIDRQIRVLSAGGEVQQETRGWSEAERRTFSQRSKEFAEDYRYFPEPDLPPLELATAWVEGIRSALPELPAARAARLAAEHGLAAGDARLLSEDAEAAAYLEGLVEAGVGARTAANWVVGELLPAPVRPWPPVPAMADLLRRLEAGSLNRDQARTATAAMLQGRTAEEATAGMAVVSDREQLAVVVDRVIAGHPQAVADFQAGKQQAIGALMAAAKAETGGSADMKLLAELLRAKLIR